MKLYGYFRSSAAFRVRIALNLKRIAYEQSAVHLRRNEQRAADFLALNPQGLVPALVLENGLILQQSMAIVEYLDETHPTPPLVPADPVARARVRALAQVISCDIHPIDNLRVLRYLASPLGQDDKAVEAWFNHWIKLGFDGLEHSLATDGQSGRFCQGDTPTLADICLIPQVFNAQRYPSFSMTPYPTIERIFAQAMTLDAFDRAQPDKQPDAE